MFERNIHTLPREWFLVWPVHPPPSPSYPLHKGNSGLGAILSFNLFKTLEFILSEGRIWIFFWIDTFAVEHHCGTIKFGTSLSDLQMHAWGNDTVIAKNVRYSVWSYSCHFESCEDLWIFVTGVRYYRGSNRDKRRRERNLQERLRKREGVQSVWVQVQRIVYSRYWHEIYTLCARNAIISIQI